MKLGFDISHWQKDVDFQKAKDSGVEFAFIKAGGAGTRTLMNYTDSYFHRNASKSQGVIPRSFYWYFVPQAGGRRQAQYFKTITNNYRRDLPLVVDVEYKGLGSYQYNYDQLRYFLDELDRDTVIYTAKWAWQSVMGNLGVTLGSLYPLWVANYPYSYWFEGQIEKVATMEPLLPVPWENTGYLYWQFTEKAPGDTYGVTSNTVDLNFWDREDDVVIEPPQNDHYGEAKLLTNLTMRTRPIVSSSTYIGVLPKGSIVNYYDIEVVNNDEKWLFCKTNNNTACWMAMQHNSVVYMEIL